MSVAVYIDPKPRKSVIILRTTDIAKSRTGGSLSIFCIRRGHVHTFSLGFLNERSRFSNAEESEEHQGRLHIALSRCLQWHLWQT